MARHFVRLKLTLLAAALRMNWQQAIGFVLSVLFVLPLSVSGFALLWWLGGEAAGGSGLRLAFALLTIAWIIGPPLLFGLDETLDPGRLRLLPLSNRQLASGLLAASAVGVGPIGTLIALSGAILGFAPLGPGAVIVVAAVVAQFVLCLVLARTVTTVLSRWLRSRRGQDVLVLGGVVLGLAFAALGQVPNLLVNVLDDYTAFTTFLERVERLVGATPLAWAGSAIDSAAEGRLLAGAGWLAATIALIAGLVAVWIRALPNATAAASPVKAGSDEPLFAGIAAVLPRTRFGAAAARELRYQWRVPQLRTQWIMIPLLGVGLFVGSLLVPGGAPPALVFAVCGLMAFHGFSAINAFGGDRGAVWTIVAAGGIQRADIAGKNAAGALVLVPFGALLAVALAATTGGWVYLPGAITGVVVVLGGAYGVGNVASVLVPAPLPESAGNIWAGSSGTGCLSGLAQGLAMIVGSVVLLPAVVGLALTAVFTPGWLLVAGLTATAYALGVWWLGLVIASRFADGRGPELVASLRGGS